jgi:predicted nucleotidyltransferase
MRFGLSEVDLQKILCIIASNYKVKKAFIFGSRAKGNYKNGSDVDIALSGINIDLNDISKIASTLNEETNMPYMFDVLNYDKLSNTDLIAHIDTIGIQIYSR